MSPPSRRAPSPPPDRGRVPAQASGAAVGAVRQVRCTRHTAGGTARDHDTVVVEEPLELRLDGQAAATVMRTPGNDRELALGFFLAEGWITSKRDVGSLAVCERAAKPPLEALPGGVVELLSPTGRRRHPPPPQRLTVSSSCGVCGKRTIEEVFARTPLRDGAARGPSASGGVAVGRATLAGLPSGLRRAQALFETTGSLHAAGLFDATGRCLVVREDVGRHNAVDKVIGWAFLADRLPLREHILHVSGRTSFEIVEKAYRAGIPLIAGISGVSSLAIELAERAGVTVVGFVRDGGFTVYSHCGRVERERARD